MSDVYVRFVTSKWDPLSAVIRFKTDSWASHVEFAYSVRGKLWTLGSRADGVKVRLYDTYPTREEWYTAPGIEQAFDSCHKLLGKKYDFLDLFGIALDTDWHEDGRYICSEAVAWSFEDAGFPLLNTSISAFRIWPKDLLMSPYVRLAKKIK